MSILPDSSWLSGIKVGIPIDFFVRIQDSVELVNYTILNKNNNNEKQINVIYYIYFYLVVIRLRTNQPSYMLSAII